MSYWTNSQLQTNEAPVSFTSLVQSARCHTFVTLRAVLWKHSWKRFEGSYLCVLYKIWQVVTESLYKVSKLPNGFSLCGTELFLALFVFSPKPKTVLFLRLNDDVTV